MEDTIATLEEKAKRYAHKEDEFNKSQLELDALRAKFKDLNSPEVSSHDEQTPVL